MEADNGPQNGQISREALSAMCTEVGDLKLTNYELQTRLGKAGDIIRQKDARIAELEAQIASKGADESRNGQEPLVLAKGSKR